MDAQNKISAAENQKPEHLSATEAQSTGIHLPTHGHNASSQHDVSPNPDPVLNYANEHEHSHLHHHKRSIQGRDNEVVYSHGHDVEKSHVPDQNALDSHHQARFTEGKVAGTSAVPQHDAEKGMASPVSLSQEEDDPRSHKASGFYGKWKILFHAGFLALMTG
jgi:concentrative nucleoside transporter, CNT family